MLPGLTKGRHHVTDDLEYCCQKEEPSAQLAAQRAAEAVARHAAELAEQAGLPPRVLGHAATQGTG